MSVACDVSNPLLGPTGAAAVYGPQKGATPDQVALLDGRLARFADLLEPASGSPDARPGRAGCRRGRRGRVSGCSRSRSRFAGFALRPGVDLVMEATDFDARLAGADLVITGEGRIDAQTGFGKTALGVARRAEAAGVPCIAVGGGVELEGIEALAAVGAVAVPVTEHPMTIEAAMAAGVAPVERCGERLARLVGLATRSYEDLGVGGAGRLATMIHREPAASTPSAKKPARKRPRKRKFSDPGRTWAKRLERYRPGLVTVRAGRTRRDLRPARPGGAGSTRPAS